jgi:hypothetical protein
MLGWEESWQPHVVVVNAGTAEHEYVLPMNECRDFST